MVMMTAEQIRALRVALKMSLREFGQALGGVNFSTISYWESGRSHPRYEHIISLNELAEKSGLTVLSDGRVKKTPAPRSGRAKATA